MGRFAARIDARALLAALLVAVSVSVWSPASADAYLSTAPLGQRDWQWQNPAPQGNQLFDVSFVTAETGWAVGAAGTVLRTTTGGLIWEALDAGAGTTTLRAVHFADPLTGWVVGDGGLIRRTVDGGTTWAAATSGTGQNLYDVAFFDNLGGWAVGAGGTLLRTTDGGITWDHQASGTPNALYAVDVLSPTGAWAVGLAGTIRKTENGTTWLTVASGTTQQLFGVHMFSTSDVVVVGSAGTIRRTKTGGQNWPPGLQPPVVTTQTLRDIGGLRGTDAPSWIVGDGGTVLWAVALADTTSRWVVQSSGTTGSLNALSAPNATAVRIVGYGGAILTSSNAGQSWSMVTQGPTGYLHGFSSTDGQSAWAVGDAGLILRTVDAGRHWMTQASGTSATLRAVDFPSAASGWAVGSAGVIRRTTDGGATWSGQSSGVIVSLNDVDFVTNELGWVVGDSGLIVRTTDGGATWIAETVGSANLRGVSFVNADRGWVVGDSGTVLMTTDGGITWVPQTSGASVILYDVVFVSETTGWAVGASGTILATTDGGQIWNAMSSGTASHLYSVSATGASTLLAAGGSGTILRSEDGGSSWAQRASGTLHDLHAAFAVDEVQGWVAGETGTILRTVALLAIETTAILDPAAPDGNDGWYVSIPTITLERNKAGITHYQWNELTDQWLVYTAPLGPPVEGETTLFYRSQDAGLQTEETRSLTIKLDTVAPSSPETITVDSVETSAITLSWPASSDPAPGSGLSHYLVRVTSADGLFETDTELATIALSGLSPYTEYLVEIRSVDVAGNVSEPVSRTVRTDALDTSPLSTRAITDPAEPDGQNGWFIAWPSIELVVESPDPDPVYVTYFKWTPNGEGEWLLYPGGPIVHSFGDGVYSLHFSTHAAPPRSPEPTRTVTFLVDGTPPTQPVIVSAVRQDVADLFVEWEEAEDLTSGVAHYEVFLNGTLRTTVPAESRGAIITDVYAGVEHTVEVVAIDVAGNRSSPGSYTFTIEGALVPAPPDLVVARAIRANEVFVAWGPSPSAGELVDPVTYHVWRAGTDEGFVQVGSVNGSSNRSFVDRNTDSSTEYVYAVSIEDARGMGALSEPASPAAQFGATTTPRPPAPRGLRAASVETSATTPSVRLIWTPSRVSNIAGYEIYRAASTGGEGVALLGGGQLVALDEYGEPVWEFVDNDVLPYQRYWYTVVAVDDTGAKSDRSMEAFVRARVPRAPDAAIPHALFNEPGSDRCQRCHAVHGAEGERLLRTATSRALCQTCHDGTGASTAVFSEVDEAPHAPDGSLGCTDCHTSHGVRDVTEMRALLSVNGATEGNAVCYGCHGTASTAPRGDMSTFESSGHNQIVADVYSAAGITCSACHAPHSATKSQLSLHGSPDGCLRCHSAESTEPDSPDILTLLTRSDHPSSRHDLLAADQEENGSFIVCQNCHNTHSANGEYPLVDPYDPSPSGVWTTAQGDVRYFCFRCHDGTLPTDADTLPWVSAPVASAGATSTADIRTFYLERNRHGYVAGDAQFLRDDMGFFTGDVLDCSSCHEPHGTANHMALRGDVRSADRSLVRPAQLVYEIAEGGYDMRFFCSACHDLPYDGHPDASVDLGTFPIDCTGCHNHAATIGGL